MFIIVGEGKVYFKKTSFIIIIIRRRRRKGNVHCVRNLKKNILLKKGNVHYSSRRKSLFQKCIFYYYY